VDAGFTTAPEASFAALACVQQVHGRDVHVVESDAPPEAGDGLWTRCRGLPIAVRVADCVPILLWDPGARAVAAVHAGWRGTALDIAGAALEAGAALGVEPRRVHAALGPSIGAECYGVGDEVVQSLREAGLRDAEFLVPSPGPTPQVDLRAANRALLLRRGVPAERVEDVGGCTRCHPERYPSFRRDGALAGRMRGVVLLPLLVLSLALGCAEPPTPEAVAAAADTAHKEGQDATVLPLLEAAVARHPEHAWLRAAWARALRGTGDHHTAIVQGRFAIGIDPLLWQAAYGIACDAATIGDEEQAIEWLQEALLLEGGLPDIARDDPDLAPLRDDHRFAFFLRTGILSLRETDAIAAAEPTALAVGDELHLVLHVIDLNRQVLAPRQPVALQPSADFLARDLLPRSRVERLAVAEHGGREVLQRSIEFTVVPRSAGRLALGPFQVQFGDRALVTTVPIVSVSGEALAGEPWSADAMVQWYRAPSEADGPALEHLRGASALPEIDPSARLPELPWLAFGDGEIRGARWSSPDGAVPAGLPPAEPEVLRSLLLLHKAEGESHLLDFRRVPATATP
jgi:YfiH family protein